TQRRDRGVYLGHLPEGFVVQVELTTLKAGPWGSGPDEPRLEAVVPKAAILVDIVIIVDVANQLVPHRRPMLAQLVEHLHVDRHASELHPGGGRHITAAEESAGEIDARCHCPQQAERCINVAHAIIKYAGPLLV